MAAGFVRVNPAAPPVQILDAWEARAFTLALSDHLFAEILRTLQKRYFTARLTPEQIECDLRLLRTDAVLAPLTVSVSGVATHPEDDLTLATALSANADYPITGDTGLLKLGTYQGVRIVSPRAFLEVLQAERSGETA